MASAARKVSSGAAPAEGAAGGRTCGSELGRGWRGFSGWGGWGGWGRCGLDSRFLCLWGGLGLWCCLDVLEHDLVLVALDVEYGQVAACHGQGALGQVGQGWGGGKADLD